jgi:bidirectional [NiFe] hydrogenase diaphorase subunit
VNVEELDERQREELERLGRASERLYCCTAAGCLSTGADRVRRALVEEVERSGRAGSVEVCGTGCLGLCGRGPLVRSSAEDVLYAEVEPADAPALADPAGRAALAERRLDGRSPFYAHQTRVVLEHSGHVDPERIGDYIAAGGYAALARALSEMTPEAVIAEVRTSGLRGRGGAGYPTALKWELVARQPEGTKYVVCNADEGDPGAFMDRSVLEGDPHRVLEGMAIAAYAVGAQQGYIYIRGEYGLAIQRLQNAIRQAEREHLLGGRVLDTGLQFRIDLRIGAGAFVCGEETALIASIEGQRGHPRQRPPYPPEMGLFDRPTLINNVETFANVPPIVERGGEWFASIGTEQSPGTKVFALAGHVRNTGLIEVPMGTSLRRILFDIGGGVPEGRRFKAAQTGGPSGGCIPEEHLDIPVDYESLQSIGSIMGSGGLIVMDDSASMVDVARYFMEFSKEESCGKCVPCRAGTVEMHEILRRLARGEGRPGDVTLLEQLSALLKETSLCGLGLAAPNPVLSTLRFFPEEYESAVAAPGSAPGDGGGAE